MKDQELDNRVQRKLDEFGMMDRISPTVEWTKTLIEKTGSVTQYSPSKFSTTGVTTLVLILILLNIGFMLTTFINSSAKESDRANNLQVISSELLINPVTNR